MDNELDKDRETRVTGGADGGETDGRAEESADGGERGSASGGERGSASGSETDGGVLGTPYGSTCAVMSGRERFENFWYHHKWHTIVALVTVVLFTVLSLQMCSKSAYDVHVLYTGEYRFSRTSANGDLPSYNSAVQTLMRFAEDFDGDGVVSVDLRDLYVMSPERLEELGAADPDADLNEALIIEDQKTLETVMLYSEYFLVFISEELFLAYEERYEGALFDEIEQYTDPVSGISYEYASEHGIYLRSLPFSEEAEICKLPEDTVVCIRRLSEVAESFNKDGNTEAFERCRAMLRKILADR